MMNSKLARTFVSVAISGLSFFSAQQSSAMIANCSIDQHLTQRSPIFPGQRITYRFQTVDLDSHAPLRFRVYLDGHYVAYGNLTRESYGVYSGHTQTRTTIRLSLNDRTGSAVVRHSSLAIRGRCLLGAAAMEENLQDVGQIAKPIQLDEPVQVDQPAQVDKPSQVDKPTQIDNPAQLGQPSQTSQTAQTGQTSGRHRH